MSKTLQQGFTLIELIIVVVVIAVLAAIAIPSYQRFVVLNAEKEAQAQMGQIEVQLERWRAKNLTYKGFVPYRGKGNCAGGTDYCYDPLPPKSKTVVANTLIYVPLGSNATNYRYVLEIADGISQRPASGGLSGAMVSLVPDPNSITSNLDHEIGQSWKIAAYPNKNLIESGAKKFMMGSNGMRCQVAGQKNMRQLTFKNNNCQGGGVESW